MDPVLDRRQQVGGVIWGSVLFGIIALYVLLAGGLHLPSKPVAIVLVSFVPLTYLVTFFAYRRSTFAVDGRFRMLSGEVVERRAYNFYRPFVSDERVLLEYMQFVDHISTSGYRFHDGDGVLIENLGRPTQRLRRMLVRGDFLFPSGIIATHTISYSLPTSVDETNRKDVRDAILTALRERGHTFPEGRGLLVSSEMTLYV